MRGAPKLTASEERRWREKCPREKCEGFVCTVALTTRHSYKICNDCNRVVGYYAGDRRITKVEYDLAVRRDDEKRRRATAKAERVMSNPSDEEDGEMAKVTAKGKQVAKGSKSKAGNGGAKKDNKGATKKTATKATAKDAPKTPKKGAGSKGSKRELVVSMLKKNVDPEKIVAAVKKAFPKKTATVENILRYKMYL